MSSEKDNTEMYENKQDEQQIQTNQTSSEQKKEELAKPEAPKEPEVVLTEEEKLKLELEGKNKEIESLKDKLLRQQAQASNDKKRYKADMELSAFETKKRFLKKILEIRDNIDRALSSFNQKDENQKVHYEGIKLIANQLDDVFANEDIKPIEAKGEMYDLTKHEIVARVPYDGPENRVIDVLQKGYTMNGKVLRSAKVAISMKKQKEIPKPEIDAKKNVEQKQPEKNEEQSNTDQK